jgi:hypothetical protein
MLDSTLRDLVTFGSPRVGDREFVETLTRLKRDRKIWRLVNGSDVIPRFYYASVPSGVMYYHPDTLLNCFPYSIFKGQTELSPQSPDAWIPQDVKEVLKTVFRLVVSGSGGKLQSQGACSQWLLSNTETQQFHCSTYLAISLTTVSFLSHFRNLLQQCVSRY